jgi:hypothetical protein
MSSTRPLSNGPSAKVPSISKEIVEGTIQDLQLLPGFQQDLVEGMVEVTKVMWNDCPENLARKVCAAKLSMQIESIGTDDPATLQAWFEEWRIELLFELRA